MYAAAPGAPASSLCQRATGVKLVVDGPLPDGAARDDKDLDDGDGRSSGGEVGPWPDPTADVIPCLAAMATNGTRRVELAASAIVLDDSGRVLLIRENYGGRRYGLPGGSVEPGETPWAAAEREAEEETTLTVRAQHVVAVCSGPIGSHVWVVSFGIRCDVIAGEARLPGGDEIADVGWYPPGRWPEPRTVMGPLLLAAALRGDRGRCIDVPRPGQEPPASIWPPDR